MDVVVVGSLNLDTTVRVARLPAPGETVLGSGHFSDMGGKGANQAVAAARLGAAVAMVGKVGDDDAGGSMLAALREEGVDVSAVSTADVGSGIAMITVDEGGENTIVVDPGANAALTVEDLAAVEERLATAPVVLAQLEVPLDVVAAAASVARGRFLLNPAPAAPLPDELLAAIDVLIPNASELGLLARAPAPSSVDEALPLARSLAGPAAIVVTLGSEGALVVAGGEHAHVAAPRVTAVDPTAAGDAFCGGLADALARKATLVEAARWAVRCGALTATRWGAQAALPYRNEVEAMEDA